MFNFKSLRGAGDVLAGTSPTCFRMPGGVFGGPPTFVGT